MFGAGVEMTVFEGSDVDHSDLQYINPIRMLVLMNCRYFSNSTHISRASFRLTLAVYDVGSVEVLKKFGGVSSANTYKTCMLQCRAAC